MLTHGWGRYPAIEARRFEPSNIDHLRAALADPSLNAIIPRGGGLSYGDSALSETVVGSRKLPRSWELDEAAGVLRCGAGFGLREVLRRVVPAGWLPPVLPGTANVTIGGAVAADIHGKNHHRDGSFCDHVRELRLLLADGEIARCGPGHRSELFQASCGGMGLTGIILEAELKLAPITSSLMAAESLPATHLEHCFDLLEEHRDVHYSVAWLDCLARGQRLGRGVVFLAEHAASGELRYPDRRRLAVPFAPPAGLLNRHSLSLFNSAYFHWQLLRAGGRRLGADRNRSNPNRNGSGSAARPDSSAQFEASGNSLDLDAYFFPLDHIRNWNLLYGKPGFLQYQFVLPLESARLGMAEVLGRVGRAGKGSFLSVLKKMGPANDNPLSFPMSGYTLALDFRREPSLFPLLDQLDRVVLDHGGRIYLAKDARMSEAVFKAGYPGWQRFAAVKQQVDTRMRFRSAQSDRIGLTGPRA